MKKNPFDILILIMIVTGFIAIGTCLVFSAYSYNDFKNKLKERKNPNIREIIIPEIKCVNGGELVTDLNISVTTNYSWQKYLSADGRNIDFNSFDVYTNYYGTVECSYSNNSYRLQQIWGYCTLGYSCTFYGIGYISNGLYAFLSVGTHDIYSNSNFVKAVRVTSTNQQLKPFSYFKIFPMIKDFIKEERVTIDDNGYVKWR